MRVWRIALRAYIKEQPLSAAEIKAEIRDLSIGGVGVKLIGKDGAPLVIGVKDRLRVVIKCEDQALIMEGRLRNSPVQPVNGVLNSGIQLKKLEDDLEGRKNLTCLTRVVRELQREETRRMQRELAPAG